MPAHRLILAALALATVALPAADTGVRGGDPAREKVLRARPYRMHVMAADESLHPHDRKILHEKKGLKVGIQMLDDRARRVFMRERLGIDEDPFYRPFGDKDRFVSFRLVAASTGDDLVYFQPQHIRLITNKQQHLYPMDLTRIYQYLKQKNDGEDPGTAYFNALTQVIFDRAETLQPGGVVEKLLVFKEPRPDSDEWVIDLPFFQVGKKSHSFRVAYAREFLDEH